MGMTVKILNFYTDPKPNPKHLADSWIVKMKRRLVAYVKRMQDEIERYQRR